MRDDGHDIEIILSNLKIHPDAIAKQAAYERMMARHAEILAAQSVIKPQKRLFGKRELSCDELLGVAAAGVPDDDSNGRYIDCAQGCGGRMYLKSGVVQPCDKCGTRYNEQK